MITTKNIEVIFNPATVLENHALKSVSVTIAKNEFVTLIGSNGAGKSTFLNVLSGDCPISRGQLYIDDKEITTMRVHQRAPFVARVFQNPLQGTCVNLTIAENFALAFMRGKRRLGHIAVSSKRRAFFRQHLCILGLGLEDRLDDQIGMLSGGQRQAISLVMSILQDSKILLLDEHTAALDPYMSDFILKLTQKLAQQHQLTILMVTHSMKDALALGTRTLMMHQGKILLDLKGKQRSQMTIPKLLNLFENHTGYLTA